MTLFKSWQKYTVKEAFDDHGTSLGMKRVEVPRWSTEATILWLRKHGRELSQNACRDGWHINLIDFVQHQHRLPNPAECEELVLDFQKIEATTQHSPKRQQIFDKREIIKTALTKPLELKAAS